MLNATDDVRIAGLRPLLPPAILMEELPIGEPEEATVAGARQSIRAILDGTDPRLVVVVGPCSLHDPEAGLVYARRLAEFADRRRDDVLVVMRVYFEKPRTIVGWKGLINDPRRDGSFAINEGLRLARGFLRDVVRLGIPTGTEFLDPISPQFVADLISWGAIGARTTESQVHRELASGSSMPIGFKNGTGGTYKIAIDAMRSAAHPHHFLSVTKQGLAAIVETKGNPYCHLILRGGAGGPNYDRTTVEKVIRMYAEADLTPRLMIDCSHANSGKDHVQQEQVAGAIADRIAAGEHETFGVMLESFLAEGRQDAKPNLPLEFGKSITDACMGWERTHRVLDRLADAARERRISGQAATVVETA